MTSRNFVFTLNNPPPILPLDFPVENGGPLEAELLALSDFRYASYQYEQGATGTFHYQGYFEFSKPRRVASLKKGIFATAHFESRRGTREQARDYTRKPESRIAGPWELGDWIGGQGARCDLSEAAATLLASRSLRELALFHPTSFVKFHRGFTALLETTREPPEFQQPLWRRWQHDTINLLYGPPHPREILWFVDFEGSAGKSFFVRYLATHLGGLPLSSGRHDRILEAWQGERIVCFDFSRDVSSADVDRAPYACIEAIKNGIVFSGMYGKPPKIFSIPHILCFSNFDPDRAKFSFDRWNVKYLDSATGDLELVDTFYGPQPQE